jgi:hypothetical protein
MAGKLLCVVIGEGAGRVKKLEGNVGVCTLLDTFEG